MFQSFFFTGTCNTTYNSTLNNGEPLSAFTHPVFFATAIQVFYKLGYISVPLFSFSAPPSGQNAAGRFPFCFSSHPIVITAFNQCRNVKCQSFLLFLHIYANLEKPEIVTDQKMSTALQVTINVNQ